MVTRDDKAKNPLGPVGERVMTNVRQLRERKRLTYKELSEHLTDLGRPIPVLGLSRLEKGERRVDADDLVALAVALGVTPNRLLMPETDISMRGEKFALTPAGTNVRAEEAWAWAAGERPLGSNPGSAAAGDAMLKNELHFISDNRRQHLRGSFDWLTLAKAARDALVPKDKVQNAAVVTVMVLGAFDIGLNTAEIRDAAESGIVLALSEDPEVSSAVARRAGPWARIAESIRKVMDEVSE